MKILALISKHGGSLLFGASNTLLIRAGGAGLAFATQVLLARTLGSTEYGIYAFAMVLTVIGGQIGSLGFGESSAKFMAQYFESQSADLARGFIRASRWLVIFANSALMLLAGAVLYLNPTWVEPAYLVPILLAFATIPFMAYQDMIEGKGLAFSWFSIALSPNYIVRQGLNILFLLVVLASGAALSAVVALSLALASVIISVIFQHIILNNRLSAKFGKGARQSDWKDWCGTSFPLALQQAFHVGVKNLDVMIIGLFLSADKMALYFAATRLTGLMGLFQYSIATATLSKFAVYAVSKDQTGFHDLVRNSTHMIFLFTLLLLTGLAVTGKFVLALFGPEFADAYTVMMILGAGVLANASVGAAEDMLVMYGFVKQALLAQIIGMAATSFGLLLLVPLFGIVGAALATSLGMAALAAALEYQVRRNIGVSTLITRSGAQAKAQAATQ